MIYPVNERPVLALADLEEHDPNSRATSSAERRFWCPLGTCAIKRGGDAHRSLSVNVATGAWVCHRCGASGKLRDHWQARPENPRGRRPRSSPPAFVVPPIPNEEERDPRWRDRLERLVPVAGTPGARYLAKRGTPVAFATAARVGYAASWYERNRNAVIFGVRDRRDQLVAVEARYTDDRKPKNRSAGQKKLGVFATPGALTADPLVVTEAPLDALSLAAVGVPSVALCGKVAADWLLRATAYRRVAIATDDDEGGQEAWQRLAPEMQAFGARVVRWLPGGFKDWNEILMRAGVDKLSAHVATLQATLPDPVPTLGDIAAELEQRLADTGKAPDVGKVEPEDLDWTGWDTATATEPVDVSEVIAIAPPAAPIDPPPFQVGQLVWLCDSTGARRAGPDVVAGLELDGEQHWWAVFDVVDQGRPRRSSWRADWLEPTEEEVLPER